MSKSYRRTPICGWTTCVSEKQDKRKANRRWRHLVRHALNVGKEPPLQREASDIWSFGKDGKAWFGFIESDERYFKLMRK